MIDSNNKSPKKQASGKNSGKRDDRSAQDAELKNMLVKGEEVILRAQIHGALYWRSVAVLLIALVLFLYIPPLSIIAGVAGAIMLCVAVLTQHYLLLVVTNKRVLARYGLLQMDVVDIRLSKIESIDLERMLLGHILGYANVVVAGTGQRIIRIPYIANGEVFRRFYNEMALADEGNEAAEEEIEKIKEEVEGATEQKAKPKNKI
jgi:hypothetical protein